jgi:hypothetical protein
VNSPTLAPKLLGNTIGSSADGFVVAEWQNPGGSPDERRLIAPYTFTIAMTKSGTSLPALSRSGWRYRSEANQGSAVFVPRGTAHTFWNRVPSRSLLLVMTTNIFSLIQEIHSAIDRSPPHSAHFSGNTTRMLG